MRQTMLMREQECQSDRTTIIEFLDWVKQQDGELVIKLGGCCVQEIDFNSVLDEFYGIDRIRLEEETK